MPIFSPVTVKCPTWISSRDRMAVEIISWPKLYERYVAKLGFELATPGLQIQWVAYCDTRAWPHLGRVKRIWYLSPMQAVKVQASLCICAVSPESLLLVHTSSESRGTLRQKARSLAPLNGWACAVKICHDGMLEDTNSLDAAHLFMWSIIATHRPIIPKHDIHP